MSKYLIHLENPASQIVPQYRFLSWGAGLKSGALLAMSGLGLIPPYAGVIHHPLGCERDATETNIAFWVEWGEKRGITFHFSDTRDIREWGLKSHIHMPFWSGAGKGHLNRQCSRYGKIRPTKRWARTQMGFDPSIPPAPPPGIAEQHIGIAVDGWHRALKTWSNPKEMMVQYMPVRYPLIELGMTRHDCEVFLKEHGLPVPVKSACAVCPFRNASNWFDMKQNEPDTFDMAVAFDNEQVRDATNHLDGVKPAPLYIWRGRVPLTEVDWELAIKKEREAKTFYQLPMLRLFAQNDLMQKGRKLLTPRK